MACQACHMSYKSLQVNSVASNLVPADGSLHSWEYKGSRGRAENRTKLFRHVGLSPTSDSRPDNRTGNTPTWGCPVPQHAQEPKTSGDAPKRFIQSVL